MFNRFCIDGETSVQSDFYFSGAYSHLCVLCFKLVCTFSVFAFRVFDVFCPLIIVSCTKGGF